MKAIWFGAAFAVVLGACSSSSGGGGTLSWVDPNNPNRVQNFMKQ
jgi:hypothetical protein